MKIKHITIKDTDRLALSRGSVLVLGFALAGVCLVTGAAPDLWHSLLLGFVIAHSFK